MFDQHLQHITQETKVPHPQSIFPVFVPGDEHSTLNKVMQVPSG